MTEQAIKTALIAALQECEEYFDNRADVNWEGDGPNTEMRLLTEVRAALDLAEGKRS
jgi:hypothetical protein